MNRLKVEHAIFVNQHNHPYDAPRTLACFDQTPFNAGYNKVAQESPTK